MPTLLDLIKEMKKLGYTEEQIINYLQQQGIEPKQILDAIKQSQMGEMIPSIMESEEIPPSPEKIEITKPVPQVKVETPESVPKPQAEIIPTVPYTREMPEATIEREYTYDIETFETLAEEIVREKFEIIKRKIEDMEELRRNINLKIKDMEERIKRVELNLDKIYLLILKRQEEEQKEIKAIGKEIDSLEKAFSKILEPLSENIKKLEEISKELKKK